MGKYIALFKSLAGMKSSPEEIADLFVQRLLSYFNNDAQCLVKTIGNNETIIKMIVLEAFFCRYSTLIFELRKISKQDQGKAQRILDLLDEQFRDGLILPEHEGTYDSFLESRLRIWAYHRTIMNTPRCTDQTLIQCFYQACKAQNPILAESEDFKFIYLQIKLWWFVEYWKYTTEVEHSLRKTF